MKVCSTCKEDKEYTNFYIDSRYLGGYANVCRRCKKYKTINKQLDKEEKLVEELFNDEEINNLNRQLGI